MAVDPQSLIESAIGGSKEDLRTLLQYLASNQTLLHQATGTSPLDPTTGEQSPSTTPPPAAAATAQGANGAITLHIQNPAQSVKATIYHEVSYSTVKNFSQNVTTLPVTSQGSVVIPAPGQAPFIQIRSSYDGKTWNSHKLVQNSSVDAGLMTSAAIEPASVLNQSNFATVRAEAPGGPAPTIRVFGPNGPYSGYVAVRGAAQYRRPSATILNADYSSSQIVAYDGKEFHLSSTLPGAFKDSWEPVGLAAQGVDGGGGVLGGNGGRLTAIGSGVSVNGA